MVLVIFIIMGILYGTTSYYTEKRKYKEVGVCLVLAFSILARVCVTRRFEVLL